jgi:hypothetical protein
MRICNSSVCHDGLYSCLCDMRMRVERVSRVDGTAEIVGASCVATSAAQKFKHRDLVCVNVYRVVIRDHRGERIGTAWLYGCGCHAYQLPNADACFIPKRCCVSDCGMLAICVRRIASNSRLDKRARATVVSFVSMYNVDHADALNCWRESSGVSTGSCRPSDSPLEYQRGGRVRHRCCCGSENG